VTLDFDGLCAEGHNLHPCAKVRTGFSPADSLAYTAECGSTVGVELVAVRRDLVLSTPDCSGRSVGDLIAEHYPAVITQAHEGLRRRGHRAQDYELVPVHPWQARTALPREYPGELASGSVVHIPEAQLACRPTVSVRSLVTAAPGRHGRRLTIKTALDVLLTSTRRTISLATTRNGPRLSALLGQLVAREPFAAGRVECVPELAGVAFAPGEGTAAPPSRQRGLSALLRADPSDHLLPGETAFTGCALRIVSPMSGRSLLIELVDVMAAQACTSRAEAAMTFLNDYADLILSVALPLMWRYGIALEAHLQNTLLVVRDHRPVRLLLRDFAGVRLHQGRMRAAGLDFTPHPGSVTVTDDLDEVRAKLAHAVVQANLASVVGQLNTACRLPAAALWEVVRGAICRTLERLEPELARSASEDLCALLAPTLPQKAFAAMRLQHAGGDIYRPQPNPLHRSAWVAS
jgi:siderophore synthetase component